MEDILISEKHYDPQQGAAIAQAKAEAGALTAVIDMGRRLITAGPYVMPFARIAIPVKTLRRRVDAAIRRANTTGAHMALDLKQYAGRDDYMAAQLDAIAVQGDATLAEVAGRDIVALPSPEDGNKAQIAEAMGAWGEYCKDAASTLAMFGETEVLI